MSTNLLRPYLVIFGFHPDAFLPFFYLSLFLFLTQKRRWLCVLFVLLCLSVKEDAAVTVGAIGLYSLIFLRELRLGIFILALSSIWHAVATGFVIPYFNQAPSKFVNNYRYLGANSLDIIAMGLSQPGYIVSLMKDHGLIVYCFALLAPFAFSALFCPEVLCIAVPALCLNLLCDPAQYVVPHSPVSWHIAPLIPCIVIAGIYGMKRVRGLLTTILRPRPSFVSSALLGVVMVTASGAHLFYGVTPLSLSVWGVRVFPLSRYPLQSELFNRSIYQRSAAEESLPELQTILAGTASLSASFFIGAHFAHRNELYWFPPKAAEADVAQKGSQCAAESFCVAQKGSQ